MFKYILANDKEKIFLKFFLKNPHLFIKYFKLNMKKHKDYYLFGVSSFSKLKLLKNRTLLIGFSYCQKPLNCPSGFFSDQCFYKDKDICKNCIIGQYKHLDIVIITTINSLGKKLLNLFKEGVKITFIITACPFAINLFKRFASILDLKGIALPLHGNVCQNFKCFEMAEKGKKKIQTIFPIQSKIYIDKLTKH